MPTAHIVGSINRDIVACVDRLPAPGETVLGSRSLMLPGGKGANQAVAVARLGGSARMIGRIGFDAFGSELVRFLKDERVDVAFVKAVPTAATGIALITVDSRSENTIAVVPGANHAWTGGLGDLRPAAGDMVVCQLEIPVLIVQAAFLQAKEAGATTVLNPAPYQALPDRLLGATDVLILNEVELGQLLEWPDARRSLDAADFATVAARAANLLRSGPKLLIVTLGAEGVLVVGGDGAFDHIDGRAVAAIDTTGAGDCFVGAFVAETMAGASRQDACAFANRAAAVSVTRTGAAVSFPTRDEIT